MSTTRHEREELDALAAASISVSRALAAASISVSRALVDAKIIVRRGDRLEAAEMLALALLDDIRRFRSDFGFARRSA